MAWINAAQSYFDRQGSEAQNNAREIYGIMSALGWSLNAICGMIGNIGYESTFNPWLWQGRILPNKADILAHSSTYRRTGYGLFQFTPPWDYIGQSSASGLTGYGPNFADETGSITDGTAQLYFMDKNDPVQYYVNPRYNYPVTWAEYRISTLTPYYLACCWLHNYERPADQGSSVEAERGELANWYYQLLSGEEPPAPEPTPGSSVIRYGAVRDVLRRLIIHA